MNQLKIIKSISLIIVLFLITSCSDNSTMKPEDFKNKEPRLIIEEYLTGNVKAWGVLQNRSGKVTNYLNSQSIQAFNLTGGMREFSQYSENIVDSTGKKGTVI